MLDLVILFLEVSLLFCDNKTTCFAVKSGVYSVFKGSFFHTKTTCFTF